MAKGLSDLQISILENAWVWCDENCETDSLMSDILLLVNPSLEKYLVKTLYSYTIKRVDKKFYSVRDIDDSYPERNAYFTKQKSYQTETKKELNKARVIANKSLNGLKKRNLIFLERCNPLAERLVDRSKCPMGDTVSVLDAMELVNMLREKKEDGTSYRSYTMIKLTHKGLEYCYEKFGLYCLSQSQYEKLLKDESRQVY